jgi:hypothetical protein
MEKRMKIKASELEPTMLLKDGRLVYAVAKTDEMVQVIWHNYSTGRKEAQVLDFDDEDELETDADRVAMVQATYNL